MKHEDTRPVGITNVRVREPSPSTQPNVCVLAVTRGCSANPVSIDVVPHAFPLFCSSRYGNRALFIVFSMFSTMVRTERADLLSRLNDWLERFGVGVWGLPSRPCCEVGGRRSGRVDVVDHDVAVRSAGFRPSVPDRQGGAASVNGRDRTRRAVRAFAHDVWRAWADAERTFEGPQRPSRLAPPRRAALPPPTRGRTRRRRERPGGRRGGAGNRRGGRPRAGARRPRRGRHRLEERHASERRDARAVPGAGAEVPAAGRGREGLVVYATGGVVEVV